VSNREYRGRELQLQRTRARRGKKLDICAQNGHQVRIQKVSPRWFRENIPPRTRSKQAWEILHTYNCEVLIYRFKRCKKTCI